MHNGGYFILRHPPDDDRRTSSSGHDIKGEKEGLATSFVIPAGCGGYPSSRAMGLDSRPRLQEGQSLRGKTGEGARMTKYGAEMKRNGPEYQMRGWISEAPPSKLVGIIQMYCLITFAHSSPQQAERYPALFL